MTKILVTATVPGHIEAFHLPLLRELTKRGWEVHVATNGVVSDASVLRNHVVSWTRSPASLGNLQALRALRRIIDRENFDVIYCHTPVGAAVTRLAAASARKKGTRVVYMAHGFHFYKGAPLVNWMVYFPVEWLLSHLTDELLVINREDFERSRKWFPTKVRLTNGVGIDISRFEVKWSPADRAEIRKAIGVNPASKMVLAVGEVNDNKNHELLVRASASLVDSGLDVDLVVAGEGPLRTKLVRLADNLGVGDHVHFLGHRDDIPQLLGASDLLVSASKREGMGINLIEAMAGGRPVLASPIRGHVDVIKHRVTGFLTRGFSVNEWASAIGFVLDNPRIPHEVATNARVATQKYSTEATLKPILSSLTV